MKKIFSITLLALLLALSFAGSASAQKDKININGQVVSVEAGVVTVLSNKGVTYVVRVPEGFDLSALQVGARVLVKGSTAPDGTIEAESIRLLGNDEAEDEAGDDEAEGEGSRENSAFCAGDKQKKPHPLAAKLATRYGVTQEWVMQRFCAGDSMGAIMLAVRTSQIEGVTASPDELLSERGAGNGWGLIWKELGLIGSEKSAHSPPGQLKKPEHAGPKEK